MGIENKQELRTALEWVSESKNYYRLCKLISCKKRLHLLKRITGDVATGIYKPAKKTQEGTENPIGTEPNDVVNVMVIKLMNDKFYSNNTLYSYEKFFDFAIKKCDDIMHRMIDQIKKNKICTVEDLEDGLVFDENKNVIKATSNSESDPIEIASIQQIETLMASKLNKTKNKRLREIYLLKLEYKKKSEMASILGVSNATITNDCKELEAELIEYKSLLTKSICLKS